MSFRPQDIVVVLKIISLKGQKWNFSRLAHDLFMSPSQIHDSTKRLEKAGLIAFKRRTPVQKSLEEFLIHGIKYVCPPERTDPVRGIVTSYAAPPLNQLIHQGNDEPIVWPYSRGDTRGPGLLPLYKNVPQAALIDPDLYEFLALVDAIREGRVRERNLAVEELKKKLDEK